MKVTEIRKCLRPFACIACGGAMYPEYYKGVHGDEYRIEERLRKNR